MNPQLNAFLSNVRIVLVLIGGYMVEMGYDHSPAYKYILMSSGAVVVFGNALWAAWSSFVNWRKASAVGVQAGINLTTSGLAVDHEGKPISKFAADASPPKPVTVASAAEIVKNFGPTPGEIAKS